MVKYNNNINEKRKHRQRLLATKKAEARRKARLRYKSRDAKDGQKYKHPQHI